jgi:hypothetical protein
VIQKYLRADLDRREVERLRNEELEFLGMKPGKIDLEDMKFLKDREKDPREKFDLGKFDIDREIERIKAERKGVQLHNQDELKVLYDKVRGEIVENDVPDIRENQLYEMRRWISDFYEKHEGKELPNNVALFYTKDDKAVPLTKEEEDIKRKLDAEKEKAKKKAEDDKKKKKKTDTDLFLESREALGPANSAALRQLNEAIDRFNNEWLVSDGNDNFDQRPDKEFIVRDIKPQIKQMVVSAH